MANTNINIRMDADLKRQFEAFCADMGMTMTEKWVQGFFNANDIFMFKPPKLK